MRGLAGNSPIWSTWLAGGPWIGDNRPACRATYDPNFWLNVDHSVSSARGPYRSFMGYDHHPGMEVEIPNIISISTDRSIGSDAADCTIRIENQKMLPNVTAGPVYELGQPGYYTPHRGEDPEAQARWGHEINDFNQVFTPNAKISTFEGYGGHDLDIYDAWNQGYVMCTGVWLVDEVNIGTDGIIELKCRDLGKLLIDQQLFPPLIPAHLYPLTYCNVLHGDAIEPTGGGALAALSSSPGHPIQHAFENNPSTHWQSGPYNNKTDYVWIEFTTSGLVDTVAFRSWAGGMQVFVCVHLVTNVWVGEGFTSAPDGTPFVTQGGVPWESDVIFPLGGSFEADKIRLVFTNLYSGNNQAPFFAGIREYESRRTIVGGGEVMPGNYSDITEVVKELVLWSGFHLNGYSEPTPYGNFEYTGIPGLDETTGCLDASIFDKKPVIDAINYLRDWVGYIVFIDPDGGFHFSSGNTFVVGQNFDENGAITTFVPEIDERMQLTDYSLKLSDSSARSEIIVGTANPYLDNEGTTTVYTTITNLPGVELLRGMVKPGLWVDDHFTKAHETERMAEEIAVHISFALRQGSATFVANPAISLDDQVRIVERQTGESTIHYIRSISTNNDARTGRFTSTIRTHWMDEHVIEELRS